MEFTLNKANNILIKLKKEARDRELMLQDYVSMKAFVSDDPDEVVAKIQTAIDRAVDEFNNLLSDGLWADIATLKTAIFSANVKTGLNEVLASLEFLNRKIRIYSEMQQRLESDRNHFTEYDKLTEEKISHQLKLLENKDNSSMYIAFSVPYVTAEKLQEHLKELRKERNQLEDRKVEINSRNKIAVDLSDEALNILGL